MGKINLRYLSLLGGIAVALFFYCVNPFGVEAQAQKVLAVAGLMITWWVTSALPLAVVALAPLVLFPVLEIASLKVAAAAFANDVIFLFMGGFMLGLAIEKWGLHRRIALRIIHTMGSSGNRIVIGFIIATSLISMWISNTATTMMMFPIALSVIKVMEENNTGSGNMKNFALTVMLAIAYSANLGGLATIIGTPPNFVYAGHIKESLGQEISFLNWMLICTPIAIILLIALYWVMVKWMYPNRIEKSEATNLLIQQELQKLGPMTVAEKRVMGVFLGTALLWMTRTLLNKISFLSAVDDSWIAIACVFALFILPSGKAPEDSNDDGALLAWKDTQKMAWGILLLFGGGIALANALEKAGLIQQLGDWLAQFSGSGFLLVLMVSVVTIFLSEVMSNVAQVIVFAPVVTALGLALNINPLLLGIPMTLAASSAGMLPMGTPPNAIVFASGKIQFKQMVKVGLIMNLIAVIIITVLVWLLLPLVG